LSCAAGIAVLDVIEKLNLQKNVNEVSAYFSEQIKQVLNQTSKRKRINARVEFDFDVAALRKKLIIEKHIFTGSANNKKLLENS